MYSLYILQQTVSADGGKEMALPVDKKRVLPTWMVQLAKTPPVNKSPPKPAGMFFMFILYTCKETCLQTFDYF